MREHAGAARLSHRARGADAARGPADRRDHPAAPLGPALPRGRRQPGADLRRPGGDRDREHAPVQRDQGSARAADRDRRDPARHQRLGHRHAAGVRRHRRASSPIDRGRQSHGSFASTANGFTSPALYAVNAQGIDETRALYPMRTDGGSAAARAVRDKRGGQHRRRVDAPPTPSIRPRSSPGVARFRAVLARSDDARERDRRRHLRHAHRARRVRRASEVDAAADLRQPGRDRDRERAPVQRDQGSARASDRHLRSAAGDQQLGGRHGAGVRQDPRRLRAPVRGQPADGLPGRRPGAARRWERSADPTPSGSSARAASSRCRWPAPPPSRRSASAGW